MNEIRIGPIASYSEFPVEIMLDDTPYWLVRTNEGEYRLLMAVCPHAGGEIRPMNGMLFCPLHFWTFHAEDGACLNVPGERLLRRSVEVRDDALYAVGDPY